MTPDWYVYCEHCDDYVAYSIRFEPVELTINDITFKYDEAEAFCVRCGNPIYVPYVNDWNVADRTEAYYKAKAAKERGEGRKE